MSYNRSNFGETTLASAITTTDGTAITVTSGTSFPAVPFLVTIDTEILKCTNKGGGTDWTVTRGEQSSTAATHVNGTKVQNNITAGDFSPLVEGPASAVDTHLAVFDSTTGKLIKDGGACTAAGLALLDDANATAQIATLGLDADIATLSLPASTTISAAGAALIDDASATLQIATLGLDADIATLSLPANTTITAAGAAILDDATAADQRTTLGGIVVGPASATDNAIVRFDATTGKLVQDSNAVIDDTGNLYLKANLYLKYLADVKAGFRTDSAGDIAIEGTGAGVVDFNYTGASGGVNYWNGSAVKLMSVDGSGNLWTKLDCSALTFTDRP
jgi:hypothetical protein